MRDIYKLECIFRRALGTTKGHKAIRYKDQLMTLISFMLKKRRFMENMNIVSKYVKFCYVKKELDFLFITPKTY